MCTQIWKPWKSETELQTAKHEAFPSFKFKIGNHLVQNKWISNLQIATPWLSMCCKVSWQKTKCRSGLENREEEAEWEQKEEEDVSYQCFPDWVQVLQPNNRLEFGQIHEWQSAHLHKQKQMANNAGIIMKIKKWIQSLINTEVNKCNLNRKYDFMSHFVNVLCL